MKKLLSVLFISLLLTLPVMAAERDAGQVAELYEHPEGRSVIFDESELVTIWYDGTSSNSGYGVSGTTAAGGLELVFYEAGQPNTTNRFNGSAYSEVSIFTGSLDVTTNTVERLVESINSDSSEEFHAAIGRDATPGTATAHILTVNVNLGIANRENDAIEQGDVLTEDTSSSAQLLAGFRAAGNTVNRMKQLTETFEGAGTHAIRVWDDDDVVWRQAYGSQADYTGSGTPGSAGYKASVTPLTIGFTDYGSKGLCARRGNSITVESTWGTSAVGTSETNSNLSIIVGEWKE